MTARWQIRRKTDGNPGAWWEAIGPGGFPRRDWPTHADAITWADREARTP